MPNIDNLDNCGLNFVTYNDEVRNLLNTLDREGQRGLKPAAPGSKMAKYVDGLYSIYVNAMLSSPRTHVLNGVSNTVPIATRMLDTAMAAGYSKLAGQGLEGVHFREVLAEAQGIGEGAVDAFRFLGAVMRNPTTALESVLASKALPQQLAAQAKVEQTRRAITGQGISDPTLRAATDWLGRTFNLPGSFLTTSDLFFKVIHYRAESAKQAMHKAIGEGLSGAELQRRYTQLRDDMYAGRPNTDVADINTKALASADARTFTNRPEGALNQWMAGSQDKGLVRWIVPFRRTMVNLFNYGIDSTPLGLSNLVRNTKTGAALRAGGADRAEALGRMAAGSMLITAVASIMGDRADGAAPRKDIEKAHWEMNGHKEYTWRVGDKHLPMDALGQFAPVIKAITDVGTFMAQVSYTSDDSAAEIIEDVASTFMLELSEQFLDAHWVSSLGPFVEALNKFRNDEDSDPAGLKTFAGRMVSAFIPTGAAVANREFSDPYVHDLKGLRSDFFATSRAKIAGLSDSMPRKIDLWGNPIRYDAWMDPDLADPITGQDEVYRAIKAVGTSIPVSRRTKSNVTLNPMQYEQFMTLAGQGVPGKPPLRDKLIQTMGSPAYKSFAHNEARAAMLENVIQGYRDAAADFMLFNVPELKAKYQEYNSEKKESFRRN